MKLKDYLSENILVSKNILDVETQIDETIEVCYSALRSGNTLFFCGNGGSAADAQHFAAEFLGRFLIDRLPLSAIALTVDTSALTAIGNDYGYDQVFSRQLQGLGKKGDVLFGLSTSGNSKNVVNAFHVAKDLNIKTVSMTGAEACDLDPLSNVVLKANSNKTNFIQEAHFVMGHYICLRVEELLCKINL